MLPLPTQIYMCTTRHFHFKHISQTTFEPHRGSLVYRLAGTPYDDDDVNFVGPISGIIQNLNLSSWP